jgi:hypothetical protein
MKREASNKISLECAQVGSLLVEDEVRPTSVTPLIADKLGRRPYIEVDFLLVFLM